MISVNIDKTTPTRSVTIAERKHVTKIPGSQRFIEIASLFVALNNSEKLRNDLRTDSIVNSTLFLKPYGAIE